MPALIFPQLLLCGLFIDRSEMGTALYWASWALPLTYSYDALARTTLPAALGGWFALDVVLTVAATVAALVFGAALSGGVLAERECDYERIPVV